MKDPGEFGVEAPKKQDLTYDSYLKVQELLETQKPLSKPQVHDEMLFIIIHQVYELWFKQILHEIGALEKAIEADEVIFSIKILKRILRIQDVLNQQIQVLETMTPNDFNYFRSLLNPASGFQSYQFRILEFRLGIRNAAYTRFYEKQPQAKKQLEDILQQSTFYDTCLHFLARQGLEIPTEHFHRDLSRSHNPSEKIASEMAKVYQNPKKHVQLYEFLELLLDMDQKMGIWRFRHVQMVERIIGITMGTGGSRGVDYLNSTLGKRAFPEIWLSRKYIIDALGEKPGEL
mgnify:CR=1 FL=1|tara:strand:- start:2978 stop:3844 length:867 start_codon:yes stop_codon:yes gene_type:complete